MHVDSRPCIAAMLSAVVLLTAPVHATVPAPTPRQAHFEVRFLENMIDHHAMAVIMAQMCIEKAAHQELRQTCQTIIATQTAEIQQMQGWLRSWYGVDSSPHMSSAGMNKLARLNGAEFEIEFMREISEHHADAIRDSTDCLLRAFHKELRDLCETIIKAQAAEINTMRTWLCQWYGECDAV